MSIKPSFMEKTITFNISLKEFKNLIRETIQETNAGFGINETNVEERMNQREAAEYLGISQVTLISWKKKGLVTCEQLPSSSKIWYYKSQLKLVLQRNPKLLQPSRK